MTTTPKVLIQQQNIPNTATAVYNVPTASKGVWIDQFDVCNYSAGAITIKVWMMPSPGAATADSGVRVLDLSVAAKETKSVDAVVGSFMNPGDVIWWQASAATSINGGASGREIN